MGHEVWPLHTVTFATHTGYGPPTGTVVAPDTLREMTARLQELGVLARCRAVLTGYIGSAETGAAVLEAVRAVREINPGALWCCDPVMGDEGRGLFVDDAVARFFDDHAAEADILLPNRFELAWLADAPADTAADALAACRALTARGVGCVVATGLRETGTDGAARISTIAVGGDGAWRTTVPEIPLAGRPNGAGDLFAATFLGRRLHGDGTDTALARAAGALQGVIAATAAADAPELRLVDAQDEIVAPRTVPEIETLA